MYNQRRCNYLKNFIEEKKEGRKLNMEKVKQELKKMMVHIAEEKVQENLRCNKEKEECENGVDKIQCDDWKKWYPTPSFENPGNGEIPRQLTKCTKTEFRCWRTSEKIE